MNTRMETNLLVCYCGRATKVESTYPIHMMKLRSGQKCDILLFTTHAAIPHLLTLPLTLHLC